MYKEYEKFFNWIKGYAALADAASPLPDKWVYPLLKRIGQLEDVKKIYAVRKAHAKTLAQSLIPVLVPEEIRDMPMWTPEEENYDG